MARPVPEPRRPWPRGDFEILEYIFVSGDLAGARARGLVLEFRNGMLNAHCYSSAFEEDATEYEYEASEEIEVGVSRRAEALAMLGEPSGAVRWPTKTVGSTDERAVEGLVWMHASKTKGLDAGSSEMMELIVWFDEDDVVCEVVGSRNH